MSLILTSFKLLIVDILGSIVYFPIWWYSKGLKMTAGFIARNISAAEQALAIGILLRYLFKPMYADYSKSGRAISLIVRFIHLIIMLAVFLLVTIFWIGVLLIWVILPPATLYFIVINTSAL